MTNSADASAPWRSRSAIDPSQLAQARAETINLVQWLVRVANSYASGDASERTTLEFRAADAAFITRRFENGRALEIRLPSLEMQFLDNGAPVPHVFDPEARSPAEVEAWILVELLHHGIDRDKFSTSLPYMVPSLKSGDADDHSPQSCQLGLGQLTALFKDAAAILDAAARADGDDGVAMICLPETLDLQSRPVAASNQLGLSLGDAQEPEPYFYVCAGAAQRARRFVATASALIAEKDPIAAAASLRKLAAG